MDEHEFWPGFLQDLSLALEGGEGWKQGLDGVFAALRRRLVFDNLAIYLQDDSTDTGEVAYARATGRGKSAEADAAWGEQIAARVLESDEPVLITPDLEQAGQDRLKQVHLLGLPMGPADRRIGALVLVRFGGPPFSEEHIRLGGTIARLIGVIFERRQQTARLAELDNLRRQLQLQEDFVHTISHELHTPLGLIKGYATTLLRDDMRWSEEDQREFLKCIEDEADHLSALIGNILESARLQSKTLAMNFQPLRLEALLREAVQRARQRYPSLQVNLDCETLPPIQGDNVRLMEVLENLLGNAVKYAPGATVDIRAREVPGGLRISVSNDGPPIPAEHLERIFERFYRLPGQSAVGGSGLGLYICRQIVQAHGGSIRAKSGAERGVTFQIDLPLQKQV